MVTHSSAPLSVSAPVREVFSPAQSFTNMTREHGFESLQIEGRLPDDLRGTLFRNGPAQFDVFGQKESHWFTGDGAVVACRLDGEGATGAHRFVQSKGRQAEQSAQMRLFGGEAPWWRRAQSVFKGEGKNTANTNVLAWNGRLFALMEGGGPVELDPNDLSTIGETNLDGVVAGMFSAHPHAVGDTWFNFGMRYGRKNYIDLYRFGEKAERVTSIEVDRPLMCHDFITTERHAVFFVAPATIVTWRAVLQVGDFPDMFKWRPELGTEVIVVPWDDPQRVTRFTVDAFYQWHFANAHERNGEIVVDFVQYPDFASFEQFDFRSDDASSASDPTAGDRTGDARYTRARIDVNQKKIAFEQRFDDAVEFPKVAPGSAGRAQQYTYLFGADGHTLYKFDEKTGRAESHDVPAHRFASEPLFTPRPQATREDDGYILSLIYDAKTHRSGVVVMDALRFSAPPQCTLWYDHHVPMTFHGTFVPSPASVS